jgi:hypothetical protein
VDAQIRERVLYKYQAGTLIAYNKAEQRRKPEVLVQAVHELERLEELLEQNNVYELDKFGSGVQMDETLAEIGNKIE